MLKRIALTVAGVLLFALVWATFWEFAARLPRALVGRLDDAGVVLGYVLSCLTVALGGIAWLKRTEIRRWFYHPRFQKVGKVFDVAADQVVCAVIPVSRPEQPEWILRWLQPQFVSFLYTEKSREVAARLAAEFSQTADGIHFFPDSAAIRQGQYQLNKPDDPEESKSLVADFLNRFLDNGHPHAHIFVDTTGGKVPMSIGAFQAAEECGVSSIYVVGTRDGLIKNPLKRDHGLPIFISKVRGNQL